MLYGARDNVGGKIGLNGRRHNLSTLTPEAALEAGIAYLPADRLGAAGVGSISVGDNIAMPIYEKLKGQFGLTSSVIRAHGQTLGAQAGVKPNVPDLPLSALSGGNAQKALVAKWLQTDPHLLLLDEPTQGVDVGARQQIWEALDATAEAGTAILIASTDYEQLAQICHRVLIFARGTITAELTGSELTKDSIAEHCYRSMTRMA